MKAARKAKAWKLAADTLKDEIDAWVHSNEVDDLAAYIVATVVPFMRRRAKNIRRAR